MSLEAGLPLPVIGAAVGVGAVADGFGELDVLAPARVVVALVTAGVIAAAVSGDGALTAPGF